MMGQWRDMAATGHFKWNFSVNALLEGHLQG